MFDCFFCSIDPLLILKEYRDFYLILDPFPLCHGHLMIISKQHYGCTGELPAELLKELDLIVKEIGEFLSLHFTLPICYEHGRAGTCHPPFNEKKDEISLRKEQIVSCDHMHLHILPLAIDLSPLLSKRFPAYEIENFQQLRRCYHALGEYLLFRDPHKLMKYYSTAHTKVPSHFLRSLIADEIGHPLLASWENVIDQRMDHQGGHLKRLFYAWSRV